MNIIVQPYGSELCYCRPDTTWERENRDFYSPECVNEILWAPVIFARVSKAGKCIGRKFVGRYYDGVNCGLLMYCNDSEIAFASCVDHTSILPMPLYDQVVMDEDKTFEVNGLSIQLNGIKEIIEDTICRASQMTSLRIGDFVAVELKPVAGLASREDKEMAMKGIFCEREIFNFNIIF